MSATIRVLLKALDLVNEISSVAMLLVTIVVVFMAAASRYVFKNPLPWTEEVARFAFIWLVFLGISIAERKRVHFRITYFVSNFPEGSKKIIWVFNELAILVALVILLVESIAFTKMGARGISAVMELRLQYIYVALPLAVSLTMINRVRNFIDKLIAGDKDYFT